MTWKDDKRWSDKFIPEITSILGQHLIGEAPEQEDALHNTDLIVLKMEPVRIACRIRRHNYFYNFKHQFTIRSSRPSEAPTELSKVIEGFGDYLFYGFADDEERNLHAWGLGDLGKFRLWFNRELWMGKKPGESCFNHDCSSEFLAFRWDKIPDFVVGQHNILDDVKIETTRQPFLMPLQTMSE